MSWLGCCLPKRSFFCFLSSHSIFHKYMQSQERRWDNQWKMSHLKDCVVYRTLDCSGTVAHWPGYSCNSRKMACIAECDLSLLTKGQAWKKPYSCRVSTDTVSVFYYLLLRALFLGSVSLFDIKVQFFWWCQSCFANSGNWKQVRLKYG